MHHAYVAELRHLAEHCEFGSTCTNSILQDRHVVVWMNLESKDDYWLNLILCLMKLLNWLQLLKQEIEIQKTCNPLNCWQCWSVVYVQPLWREPTCGRLLFQIGRML